jgi:hypothetical protein
MVPSGKASKSYVLTQNHALYFALHLQRIRISLRKLNLTNFTHRKVSILPCLFFTTKKINTERHSFNIIGTTIIKLILESFHNYCFRCLLTLQIYDQHLIEFNVTTFIHYILPLTKTIKVKKDEYCNVFYICTR